MKHLLTLTLGIVLLWGCQKKTSPTKEKQKVDLSPKKVQFQNLTPNVTSMQWEYNNDSFALKQISRKRVLVSQVKETDDLTDVLAGDSKIFKYTVFSREALLYTGFVKIPVSMHTFYYERDKIPHEKSQMTMTLFNVNIPLDTTAVIYRVIFSEVIIRDGRFSTNSDSLINQRTINREVIINKPENNRR